MQQPGQMVKPVMPSKNIPHLVYTLYGLTVTKCTEYDSYDDLCFQIHVDPKHCANTNLKIVHSSYVLKILNCVDSKNNSLLDAQHMFMNHLRNKGISDQTPIPNVHGRLWSVEKFVSADSNEDNSSEDNLHVVEVRTFIPGICISQVPYTKDLFRRVGEYMGRLRLALQDFHHPFYKDRSNLWSMTSVPKLRQYSYCIHDDQDRQLVHGVIDEFENNFLPVLQQLPQGIIHGDANDNNLLVKLIQDQGGMTKYEQNYDISGIIDFFDVHTTACIVDLSIAMFYMMLESMQVNQLDVPGYILSGYRKYIQMTPLENGALYMLIVARLCTSLIMGAHAHSIYPESSYVTITKEKGWPLLRKLWTTPRQELHDRWMSIANCREKN